MQYYENKFIRIIEVYTFIYYSIHTYITIGRIKNGDTADIVIDVMLMVVGIQVGTMPYHLILCMEHHFSDSDSGGSF